MLCLPTSQCLPDVSHQTVWSHCVKSIHHTCCIATGRIWVIPPKYSLTSSLLYCDLQFSSESSPNGWQAARNNGQTWASVENDGLYNSRSLKPFFLIETVFRASVLLYIPITMLLNEGERKMSTERRGYKQGEKHIVALLACFRSGFIQKCKVIAWYFIMRGPLTSINQHVKSVSMRSAEQNNNLQCWRNYLHEQPCGWAIASSDHSTAVLWVKGLCCSICGMWYTGSRCIWGAIQKGGLTNSDFFFPVHGLCFHIIWTEWIRKWNTQCFWVCKGEDIKSNSEFTKRTCSWPG